MQNIRSVYYDALKNLHDRQLLERQELHSWWLEKQRECPFKERKNFEDWTYSPDPSGNNDSEFECMGCGAVFRRVHP